MSTHAVAIRRGDGTVALFLRVVRSLSGIYAMFAAGQHRAGHDPHSSWHRDGRVHHKSFGREFTRRYRQALGAFAGAEPFITTSVSRDAPRHLQTAIRRGSTPSSKSRPRCSVSRHEAPRSTCRCSRWAPRRWLRVNVVLSAVVLLIVVWEAVDVGLAAEAETVRDVILYGIDPTKAFISCNTRKSTYRMHVASTSVTARPSRCSSALNVMTN